MATAIEPEAPQTPGGNGSRTTQTRTEHVTETTPPSSKKKFVLPIVGVVALLVLFWGFQKWNYGRTHQSTDNAQVDGHIVPVLAKVGGYVKSVSVNENDHVNAGQQLVQLDDADYVVRLQQAQADLVAIETTAAVP